jgi:preprotein translocase subunit SecF
VSTPQARNEGGTARERGAATPATRVKFTEIIPPNTSIDFVGKRRFFVILSTVLNVVAVILLLTWGLNFGIDFAGGTDVRVRFAAPTTASDLRGALEPVDLPDLTVQEFGEHGKEFLLRFDPSDAKQMSTVEGTIKDALGKKYAGDGSFELLSVEIVGPRVGAELRQRGFLAVVCTTIFMGIYIAMRFDLAFGLGAVVALVHDVLLTLGALVLTRTIFDLTVLAAMLTIIGFSVNDTIIVSDRVRENLRKMRRSNLADVINVSINETLSRTILTNGTAIIVTLALYLVGGAVLQGFAFTLLVGFIAGTYSSIYIAAPVVLYWSSRSTLAHAE